MGFGHTDILHVCDLICFPSIQSGSTLTAAIPPDHRPDSVVACAFHAPQEIAHTLRQRLVPLALGYPVQPAPPVRAGCRFFQQVPYSRRWELLFDIVDHFSPHPPQGHCKKGTDCKFSHDATSATTRTPCAFWQKGTCRFGSSCRFQHSGYVFLVLLAAFEVPTAPVHV